MGFTEHLEMRGTASLTTGYSLFVLWVVMKNMQTRYEVWRRMGLYSQNNTVLHFILN
jgi:hypothetical protein